LLHTQPHQNGDLFFAERASTYADDPVIKLQAAVEIAARSLTEQLTARDSLTRTQPSGVVFLGLIWG